MLKHRILTALLLVPLVVTGVLGLDSTLLGVLLGAVILLAGWEWSALAGLAGRPARVIYLTALGLFLLAVAPLASSLSAALPVTGPAVVGWGVAAAWVLVYQRSAAARPAPPTAWLLRLLGPGLLVPPWLALVALHASGTRGPWLVLFLLVLIWTADSGAYFVGRTIGKHKMAPKVSPKTTWEGAGGGVVVGVAAMLIVCWPLLSAVPRP